MRVLNRNRNVLNTEQFQQLVFSLCIYIFLCMVGHEPEGVSQNDDSDKLEQKQKVYTRYFTFLLLIFFFRSFLHRYFFDIACCVRYNERFTVVFTHHATTSTTPSNLTVGRCIYVGKCY